MAQAAGIAQICCIKTEQTLEQIVGGLTPGLVETESFGTAAAILDSERNGIISKVQTESTLGKGRPTATSNRKVQVEYRIPDCTAADNTNYAFDCTLGTPAADTYGYDDMRIEDFVSDRFSVGVALYDDNCKDPLTELANKMRDSTRKLIKSYNDKLAAKMLAAVGNYYTDAGGTPVSSLTTPDTLPLFSSTAPIKPQPMAMFDVSYQYERMGVSDRPIYMIGGSKKFQAFMHSQRIFNGNLDGHDSSKVENINMYKDWRLDPIAAGAGIAGTERLITFVPGSVSVCHWYEFDNVAKAVSPTGRQIFAPVQASGTLVRQKVDLGSVFFGREFIVDMEIKYDECGNTITYTMRKDFDLWKIPQGAFSTQCNQAHNYLLMWNLDCADYVCANIM
jgi:hypothetical protein